VRAVAKGDRSSENAQKATLAVSAKQHGASLSQQRHWSGLAKAICGELKFSGAAQFGR